MRPAAAKLSCLLAGGAIVIAAAASDVRAQTGRALGASRYSGNMRQNYAGSQASGRLPFSSSGAAASQGLGGRGGIAQQGRLGGGLMGGQNAMQQGPLNANLAQAGAERFQQGGFVGRDAGDVRQGFESQGRRGGGQMLDQMIENLNEMRDSRRRWREQNAAPPPVRVQLRPSFAVPPQVAARSTGETHLRLGRMMQHQGVISPQVEFGGRTVVLRGTVATEHDRALVGQLAALEPGVSQVENLLTVQTPPAAPQ